MVKYHPKPASKKALRKKIGDRFAKFRAAVGKTQLQLARELMIYQSTITKILEY